MRKHGAAARARKQFVERVIAISKRQLQQRGWRYPVVTDLNINDCILNSSLGIPYELKLPIERNDFLIHPSEAWWDK